MNTARDRAEELLQNLQKKAREHLDAGDGWVAAIRDLVETNGLQPAEVRRRIETLVGRIKVNEVWENIRNRDGVSVLSDYRDGVEKRVGGALERFGEILPVATRAELTNLAKQVQAVNRKFLHATKDAGQRPQ